GGGPAARPAGPRRPVVGIRQRAADDQRQGPAAPVPSWVRRRDAPPVEGAGRMTPSPAEIQDWLVARVSLLTEIPPAELDVRVPLMYYGLDSAALITLTADLETWLGYRFGENPLDAHPTIEALSRFLAE